MYRISLALRYLRRRKVAYVSVLAIAAGVMAMIVVNSVMEGFQRRIKDSIFKIDGTLKVELRNVDPTVTPDYGARILKRLEPFMVENGGEVLGASPRIVQPAMISTRERDFGWQPSIDLREEFIHLVGIDAEKERAVTPLDELLDAVEQDRKPGEQRFDADGRIRWDRRIPKGERQNIFLYQPENRPPSSQAGIVLGSQLAERMLLERGGRVTIITAARNSEPTENEIESIQERFVVSGAFESGRYEYDKGLAFCDIKSLRRFLGWQGDCSEMRLALKDPSRAAEVKKAILASNQGRGTDELVVLTWEDQMKTLAQALEFERLAMGLVTAFVVIVAGVSIGGLLYMVVLEKTRDIGILQSMGATSLGLVQTFLLYGGLLGLLGTGLGVWLGIYVAENLDGIIHWLEDVLNRELFPPDVYEFGSLPSHLDSEMIAYYAGFTFAWCLLVSILPAFFAARLDPLKCLSYE